MESKYDLIGKEYTTQRKSDPKIAKQIHAQFLNATKILNIGAGSYEPSDVDLVAIEPSATMIAQRPKNAHPVIQGVAEELPFKDKSFSQCMTVLSMHHWADRTMAFKEINRVTIDKFVAVSWDPASIPFWLTKDYFSEIYETDKLIFPPLDELHRHFDEVKVSPLLIPHDCEDGFLAAYWQRPEAYLKEEVRNSISTFSKIKDLDIGLDRLRKDIETGEWLKKNPSISKLKMFDAGYVLINAKIKTQS